MSDERLPKSKCVQSALKDIEKKHNRILSFDDVALKLEAIADGMPQSLNSRVSLGYESGSLQGVLFHMDVSHPSDCIIVRRRVRQLGYEPPEVSEYPELKRRSWTYNLKGKPQVIVSMFLPFDGGAKCDFVQVGTKELPVYKLQCGEMEV